MSCKEQWRAWYNANEAHCWQRTLPDFLLCYSGLTSFVLYQDYYIALHTNRTQEAALSLWTRVLGQAHQLYLNKNPNAQDNESKAKRFRAGGYTTYLSLTHSPVLITKYHSERTGFKADKFLDYLRTETGDTILSDAYEAWMRLLGTMITEKLGDPFLIHHLAIQLINHSSGLNSSVHQLWEPIFNTSCERTEVKLQDGIRFGLYDETFRLLFQNGCRCYPQMLSEVYYFHSRPPTAGIVATTFAELEANDRANMLSRIQQRKARKDAKESKETKESRETKETKEAKRSHKITVKAHLHGLDQLALAEYKVNEKNIGVLDPSTRFQFHGTRVVKDMEVYLYEKNNENKQKYDCALIGPFSPSNSMHQLVLGRVLFRSRKMREWYASYFTTNHDAQQLRFPFVTMVSHSHSSNTSSKNNEVWLHYEYNCKLDWWFNYKPEWFPNTPFTYQNGLLILQLFRCLLGIAEHSTTNRKHTVTNSGHYATPFLMMKMRGSATYDSQVSASGMPSQHRFLFSHTEKNDHNWCASLTSHPLKDEATRFLTTLAREENGFKGSFIPLVSTTLFRN